MKTRNLRIKRKVVVKSRKKGKLNRKISNRRKQRKSMMRRQKRNSRNNFKKRFSKKMRGGDVVVGTQNFYKSSYGFGWKNASFIVNYDTDSEIMRINWNSKNYPHGFTINFNEEHITRVYDTVNAVDEGTGKVTKIVQLYTPKTAIQFKKFLDSFLVENQGETNGEGKITADVLIEAIGEMLYNEMPVYKEYKDNKKQNTPFFRDPATKDHFMRIASRLSLIDTLNETEKLAIKKEIVEELMQYLVTGTRHISSHPGSIYAMELSELLYYKWENDIHNSGVRALTTLT